MSCANMIKLNVGGVELFTNKSTLLDTGSSFFKKMLINDEDLYFIDRDGGAFALILNYLRQGSLNVSIYDTHFVDFLLCEASFYELPKLETDLMQVRENIQSFNHVTLSDIHQELKTLNSSKKFSQSSAQAPYRRN